MEDLITTRCSRIRMNIKKDFANYWYTERAKNPKYSDQIGGDKLGSVLSNIDKATWKTPTEAMRDNMVGQGYNPTDAQINQQLNILKEKGTKGFANPKSSQLYFTKTC